MTRVLVCGGRDYNDEERVFGTLDEIHKRSRITAIIQGYATGADDLAREWGYGQRNCAILSFAPDWNRYGKAAGPKRNAQMLAEGKPDLVVAFPGGKGTANMVAQARAAGIEVIEVE
jgi:hypothetical protein